MRTAMSASRRSRLVSSFEATSSISISGCGALQARQHRRQQPGRRDLAGRDADDAARRRARRRQAARRRASAASSMRRAASTMASAAPVGTTPRPVRSNSGAPSCASSSATWRLSVGWLRAAALGGGADAAGVEDGEEAAHEGPVEVGERRRQSCESVWLRMQQSGMSDRTPRADHTSGTRQPPSTRRLAMNPASAPARTVLVLGANGRFGLAAAQAFAAAGWHVLAHVRRDAAAGMPAGAELVRAPLGAARRRPARPSRRRTSSSTASTRSTRAGTRRRCRQRAPRWTWPSASARASCCPATSTTTAQRCRRGSTRRRRSGRRPPRDGSASRWRASSSAAPPPVACARP